jgi:hypothetical protein
MEGREVARQRAEGSYWPLGDELLHGFGGLLPVFSTEPAAEHWGCAASQSSVANCVNEEL